ncbi:TauD/TfdA family dioxygenase [Micromonospora sp. NPDC005979]|uniref:TauD/TfdA family dioxygenase n=1 Tax=Micromonospora sp. NPDC005979 TaxID=3156726 RepID=UPI0033A18A76
MDFSPYRVFMDPADVARLERQPRETWRRQVGRMVDAGGIGEVLTTRGIAVLSGLDDLSGPQLRVVFPLICEALGTLIPQSVGSSAQLLREVTYRGNDLSDRTLRYSDSRAGGSFHTDGVPVPGEVPDLIALLCLRQAAAGGELVFIDSQEILRLASAQMPDILDVLGNQFHFDQRRKDAPGATIVRRVVERSGADDGTHRLTYLRDYIESGHAMPGVRPLTPAETRAMDLLDAVMASEALHIEGRLLRGQIVISDNRRYLHGRHAFVDASEGAGRLMLRAWIRR